MTEAQKVEFGSLSVGELESLADTYPNSRFQTKNKEPHQGIWYLDLSQNKGATQGRLVVTDIEQAIASHPGLTFLKIKDQLLEKSADKDPLLFEFYISEEDGEKVFTFSLSTRKQEPIMIQARRPASTMLEALDTIFQITQDSNFQRTDLPVAAQPSQASVTASPPETQAARGSSAKIPKISWPSSLRPESIIATRALKKAEMLTAEEKEAMKNARTLLRRANGLGAFDLALLFAREIQKSTNERTLVKVQYGPQEICVLDPKDFTPLEQPRREKGQKDDNLAFFRDPNSSTQIIDQEILDQAARDLRKAGHREPYFDITVYQPGIEKHHFYGNSIFGITLYSDNYLHKRRAIISWHHYSNGRYGGDAEVSEGKPTVKGIAKLVGNIVTNPDPAERPKDQTDQTLKAILSQIRFNQTANRGR